MKIIISPAKTLDFETKSITSQKSQPKYAKEAEQLVERLKKYSAKDLSKLMDLSEKLAELNYARYQNFAKAPKKQAVLAYMGDVYAGLQASGFTEKDLEFAQEHLRILSGLYGLLKPLDLIKPYRLEMSTNIGLYEFWAEKLTKEIENEFIINLASKEYSNAIESKNMLNVDFKEDKNGKLSTIGLFAKKARGMMARYIIKNRITEIEEIKKFNEAGYKYNAKLSKPGNYVFTRKIPKAKA